MCGICGKLYFNREHLVDEQLIYQMCEAIRHRGPDESGMYTARNIGLGHRRLSIIDLSTGQQPMSNERQDIWVVFNGEIYNFLELRKELERSGYTFHTHSDTEVIIHLYDKYGTSCVTHLRGMFAFAIWDARKQRLFLSRDRVGQKPLFYVLTPSSITFSSEIKSLLKDGEYQREVNLLAMYHYLTYQYIPPSDTIFQNISKLPPAHSLVWEDGKTQVQQYWDLSYIPKTKRDEHELIEEVTTLLQESVKMRMISDVPLGAFLSGGIDSSLIVAIMSQYTTQPVKTFSIGFKEKTHNELPYARLVAKRYHTEHYEFIVEPNAVEILPKLIWQFDEPFGDPSAIPTYYLSQMTSHYVKVALNGDGGDESFAGYQRYLGHTLVKYYNAILPSGIRHILLAPLLNWLSPKIQGNGFFATSIRRGKYLNDLSFLSHRHLYIRMLTIFHDTMKWEILSDDLRTQFQHILSHDYTFQYFSAPNVEHFTDKMLYSDVMTYLPGDLLVKVDRTTMAFGLEGRSPFLDHRLMEFVATIPADFKLQNTCLKYLLKRIAKRWLPEEIVTRQKQGFGVPIGKWFREELRPMLNDVLGASRLVQDGILKGKTLRRMLQEHQTGKVNHQHRIWVLLNLELWYRMFIHNDGI